MTYLRWKYAEPTSARSTVLEHALAVTRFALSGDLALCTFDIAISIKLSLPPRWQHRPDIAAPAIVLAAPHCVQKRSEISQAPQGSGRITLVKDNDFSSCCPSDLDNVFPAEARR
jgi:hypothetical protein